MKSIYFCTLSALAVSSGQIASAQGTFQNLDFENANIVPISGSPYYPYAVTVANALPGWTVEYGNVQQTQTFYNDAALGGEPWVTLYANGYTGGPVPVIDGNVSLLLQGGEINGVITPASISQTGQVPSGTESLLFDVGNSGQSIVPQVLIGNDSLTLFPVGTGKGAGTSYTIYGANIPSWSGQTEQLTISSQLGNILIDDISFSPNSITVTPEPNPLLLTGIGGLLFGLYRRLQATGR